MPTTLPLSSLPINITPLCAPACRQVGWQNHKPLHVIIVPALFVFDVLLFGHLIVIVLLAKEIS
jgi:hypothetical protein